MNDPGSYDFSLRINNSTTTEISYLPGSTVTLTFNIPSEAWVDNAEFYLYAGNLSASTGNTSTLIPNSLGFNYKPASPGIQTLNFTTNTVTSTETVTLLSDASVVSFNEDKVTYTNVPITGTVTYDGTDIPPGDFVAMERGDGLRIGKLIIEAGGTYTLTFYPDYKLNVTDEIIFTYTQNDNDYQYRITVRDLCSGTPALRLTKITS